MLSTLKEHVPSFRKPRITKSFVRGYLRRLLVKHSIVIVKLGAVANIRFDDVGSVTLLRFISFLFLLQKCVRKSNRLDLPALALSVTS